MKTLTLVIALASSTLMGVAQENNAKVPPAKPSSFSIGAKGGFGHSFLTPYKNTIFCPSWDAGISAIYSVREHWGVGLDVIYSAEGAKFEYLRPTGETYDIQQRLNYVRVPVKAIYFFNKYDDNFRPKVALGPTLGILVSEENSKDASTIDLGANLTLGFNYRIARGIWINVDATYYQGFLDVYSNTAENELNGNIRLDAGINFGF